MNCSRPGLPVHHQLPDFTQTHISSVTDSWCPTLWPHGLQHARLPCPSPTPGAYSNSLSRWCHPTISSSAVPFSSCLPSFPTSGSFSVSQLIASGGQNIGASALALVLLMNIQDWFLFGLTNLGERAISNSFCLYFCLWMREINDTYLCVNNCKSSLLLRAKWKLLKIIGKHCVLVVTFFFFFSS